MFLLIFMPDVCLPVCGFPFCVPVCKVSANSVLHLANRIHVTNAALQQDGKDMDIEKKKKKIYIWRNVYLFFFFFIRLQMVAACYVSHLKRTFRVMTLNYFERTKSFQSIYRAQDLS